VRLLSALRVLWRECCSGYASLEGGGRELVRMSRRDALGDGFLCDACRIRRRGCCDQRRVIPLFLGGAGAVG